MIKKATEILLSGEGILAHGIPGWCYVFLPKQFHKEITEQLNFQSETLEAYLPLPVLDHLQIYCSQVPDIAWDLMDFAESPLIVCLKGVKNLGLTWDGHEAILGYSVNTSDDISLLSSQMKEPLLAIPLSGSLTTYLASIPEEYHNRLFTLEKSDTKTKGYKVYYLEKNGTINRLKA